MRPHSILTSSFAFGLLTLSASTSVAAPKFSLGVAVKGAIAYQDDAVATQFHYLPASVPVILGDTLTDFKFAYWGVGAPMLLEKDGFYKSSIGGVAAGSATPDLTPSQRILLTEEIEKAFKIKDPKLLPLSMRNVSVQPVFSQTAFGFNAANSDIVFPKTWQIGTKFNFSVGTSDSRLFAQAMADRNIRDDLVVSNPLLGVNITGEVEFVGDPWTAECTADLSQVWKSVRERYSVSASLGWFDLGSADYANISQELTRTKVIDCKFSEGSLDNEKFGRQILEAVKKVMESLNAESDENKFFRFEPNPNPQEIGGGSASAKWPWSVSVNAAYSSAHFKQKITFNQKVSYTGRFYHLIPMSMTLAVSCNSATEHLFSELGVSEPCVTPKKARDLAARQAREAVAKNARLARLLQRLENGEITPAQYSAVLAAYREISFVEDLQRPTRNAAGALAHQKEKALADVLKQAPKTAQALATLDEAAIDRLEQEAITRTPR